MLDAFAVFNLIDAQHFEALGHGVVAVVEAMFFTTCWHAYVHFHGIILLHPFQCFLHAAIIFIDTCVDHALDAGVGDAGITRPRTCIILIGVGLGFHGVVDETAIVVLPGPGLILLLALEILAATEESGCLLEGRVIRFDTCSMECFQGKPTVAHVRPVLAVVAKPTVEGVLRGDAFIFIPLQANEELSSCIHHALILPVLVGCNEGHHVDCCNIVLELLLGIRPCNVTFLGVHQFFEIA